MSNRSDTPIFDALWEKTQATPIYDQLVSLYEVKKYQELVEPYQPSQEIDMSLLFPDKPDVNVTDEDRFRWADMVRDAIFKHNKEKTMNTWQQKVNEFREAMDLPVSEFPRQLTGEEAEMHIKMIRDEFEKEFVPFARSANLIEFYDAGIDVIVYVIGAMSNAGFDLDPGFLELMRSNMTKMDPETKKAIRATKDDPNGEPEGKVLKGPNYVPPKLGPIVNEMGQYGATDNRIYKNIHVPLTFGVGGPKIGEGVINMDHDGRLMFEGTIDVDTAIPIVDQLGYQVSALSIGSETVLPAPYDAEVIRDNSRIFDEALSAGQSIIAQGEQTIEEDPKQYLKPARGYSRPRNIVEEALAARSTLLKPAEQHRADRGIPDNG